MVEQSQDPERNALAAELALGLLQGAERAEALRLCLSDPAFAAEVERWSVRLAPMLDAAPHADPSPKVWDAVAVRIGTLPSDAGNGRLQIWRAVALISTAMAACLVLFVAMRPAEVAQTSSVAVTQLAAPANPLLIGVAYDQKKGVLRFGPQELATGAKSPELWVIPSDGVPRSLGMMDRRGAEVSVAFELRPFMQAGSILAITLEDAATAPHKAPTAMPILTGKISII